MTAIDGHVLLAPELWDRVASLPYQPPTSVEELAVMRFPLPALGTTHLVERIDVAIDGDPPVKARVHRPRQSEGPLPCIVSIHGGGYVAGSQALDDYNFEMWVPRLGVVGVSLDYRLAPEAPFPAALDDCTRVVRWVVNELKIDRARIGLMGTSAGGGLAAGLVLRLRDAGTQPFAFIVLDAPMLDDRQDTPSSRLDKLAIWTREANAFGWRSYLGDVWGTDDVSPYAAPARATDLSGLPPILLTVGTADGFRDEVHEFARRLAEQGAAVDYRVYAGAPHGYAMFSDWPVTVRATRDKFEWASRQLGSTLTVTESELAEDGMTAILSGVFGNS